MTESSDSVTLSRDEFDEIKGQLMFLDNELSRLLAQPLVYATVVKADNKFNLEVFEQGDRMLVIDKALRKQKKWFGKLVSAGVDENGWAIIEYSSGGRDRLNIGMNGELPQVKLLGKDDGMNVVITFDGKLFEVHGLPGVFFNPSDNVKVDMETKQIHSATGVSSAGDVCFVKALIDEDHVEVETNGSSRVVIYGLEQEIEPSDRVMLDNSNTVILRVLEKDNKDKFNLATETNVEWDDLAGLADAKEAMIEALETPYRHPEVYKFYNRTPPKGILLFGPPGCGKTLCGKAAATSLAKTHGKTSMDSGFIYVKGPELLNMYVGNSEAQIRSLFARGEEHYEKNGYPALLFIDEADAILPMRGSGKSSDVENTIVPQFLSEMDGLLTSHVMVLLATNQPKRLDPAVVREGRCDVSVKINRPDATNAMEYFRLHMRNTPLAKGLELNEVANLISAELFNPKRVLYRVTHQKTTEVFRLADVVTGAMIAAIVEQAKGLAMKRDLAANSKKPKGVLIEDFHEAVQHHYVQHSEMNSTFDLEDFCDKKGFDRKSVSLEKLPVAR